ncbi:DUF3352 domain-containing protein [Catellatospora tritici]|uniref:DUF3352 domain-containing protein n=1 Tax=Catellatospora tritici TaxID=2851566 RepID=UPI001C2DC7E0|nr:DUF3352 domain-containing protein [Catellatospora tritici]MBV1848695.1 DUF3352 domain-containing protein [Catellatospora tritici]
MSDPAAPVDHPSAGASAESAPAGSPLDPTRSVAESTAAADAPGSDAVITLDAVDAAPAAAAARPRRTPVLIAAVIAVVLLLGVGAYAVYRFAFGDGRHIEEALPGSAVMFASVDLDTGLEQQIRLLQLARHLPEQTKGDADADQRDELLGQVLKGMGLDGVDVDRDLLSWAGRRVGLSVWQDGKKPYALIAVTSTDSAAATAGLGRMRDAAHKAEGSLGFVVRDGIALVALGTDDTQQAAEKAFAEAQRTPLSTATNYAQDRAWLEGDQLAVFWADMGQFSKLMNDMFMGALSADPEFQATLPKTPEEHGRVILGVRATDSGLEARYRQTGADQPAPTRSDALARLGALPGDTRFGAVVQLPADTIDTTATTPFGMTGIGGLSMLLFGMPAFASGGSMFGPGDEPSPGAGVPTLEPDVTFPTPTEAELKEIDALAAKGFDKLTDAERKRFAEITGMNPGELGDLGDMGVSGAFGPSPDQLAALNGAQISVSVNKTDPTAEVRVDVAATSPTAADNLVKLVESLGAGLNATADGSSVTAITKGYVASSSPLSAQPAFQSAIAGLPSTVDTAVYLDLAALGADTELPVRALVLAQSTEGGDQTGVLRLLFR